MPDVPDRLSRDALEALVGRPVGEAALYVEALTHRSLTRDPAPQDQTSERSNERLEFLGDALVGAEVAEALFHRFPEKSEGDLSRLRARLVNGQALARCYRTALRLADEREIASVAVPALSTGAFGYPMEEAAQVALDTVREALPELKHVRLVRFVLYNQSALDVHERVLAEVFPEPY